MNDNAFFQCKNFLEQRIADLPDNVELVKAYVSLIEQKTQFDIALCSQNTEIQKSWNDNQMEVTKHWQTEQTKIAKQKLESSNNHRSTY